jgi:hypothetical protein
MLHDKIISAKEANPTFGYGRIAKLVGCAKNTAKYHLDHNQKAATMNRVRKYRASNPIIRKIDSFNHSSKKKGIDNKIWHFDRTGRTSPTVTVESVLSEYVNGAPARCYLTGDAIDVAHPASYHFDHKIPVSQGGSCTLDNLGLCTRDANLAKHDKTPEQFFEICKKVLIHNGYTVIDPPKGGLAGETRTHGEYSAPNGVESLLSDS